MTGGTVSTLEPTSSSSVLLLILLALPLVGAAVVASIRDNARAAKATALAFALASLVLTAVAWLSYSVADAEAGARFQLEFAVPWIPAFGTSFALGIDGIALVMLALIAVLVPIVMGFSWEEKLPEGRTAAGFYSLLLATQGLLVGVFAATDVFLFYVFFEAMLIPMYFLIGRFGGPRRQYAAVKFFLYSLLGGLIMLASVIGLYVVSGTRLDQATFSWTELQSIAATVPESTQIWLFLGFFVAFAIKAPLVPLHTWLPDAAAEAPIGVAVLLVGVLDKVGTFGFLRYCLPMFPEASKVLAPLLLVLSVIGVLYGSILAAGQRDMKRFIAYVSIAHFGFISLGILTFVLGLVALPFAMWKTSVPPIHGERLPFRSVLSRVMPYGTGLALASIGFGSLSSFVALYYTERGWGGAALSLSIFGACYIGMRLIFGNAIGRFGGYRVAIVSMLVESIGLIMLWQGTTPHAALAAAAPYRRGWGAQGDR